MPSAGNSKVRLGAAANKDPAFCNTMPLCMYFSSTELRFDRIYD